jgi:Family of unknown function (DUF6338)
MPTTFTGLALFAVLLLPGLAYVMIRERYTPRRDLSAFRETVQIVAVSVVALILTIVVAAMLRALAPDHTPDIDELVQERGDYAVEHYSSLTAWSIGLLLLATVGAGGAGWILRRRQPHTAYVSSWWELFKNRHPERHVHVGCVLDDGTYVGGYLGSFTLAEQETPDRDLILTEPITYRPARKEKAVDPGAQSVCVSAARIKVMFVTSPPPAVAAEVEAER